MRCPLCGFGARPRWPVFSALPVAMYETTGGRAGVPVYARVCVCVCAFAPISNNPRSACSMSECGLICSGSVCLHVYCVCAFVFCFFAVFSSLARVLSLLFLHFHSLLLHMKPQQQTITNAEMPMVHGLSVLFQLHTHRMPWMN